MQNQILFVTRRLCPQLTVSTISPEEARSIAENVYGKTCPLAHDIETTGENPYISKLLLDAWYDGVPEHPVLVLDSLTVHTSEVFTPAYLKNRLVLAHNADFEKRWALVRGVKEGIFHCTMVTEQVLTCGISEFHNDIVSSLTRRGIPLPVDMDKETRNEFIGVDPDTFVIKDKHIRYNASDVVILHELHAKQQAWVTGLGMSYLVNFIRRPLVSILAETELLGFVHDQNYWRDILNRRIIQAEEFIKQLNKYLTDRDLNLLDWNPTLAEIYAKHGRKGTTLQERLERNKALVKNYEENGKVHIKAYVVCKEQVERVALQLQEYETKPLPEPSINWSSPQQPLNVMKNALKMTPLPMANDKETHRMKEGVGKEARNNWFAENEHHEHIEFMKLFDKFKKIEHNIKSFGEAWIQKYTNPVTGKVHTCFRQAGTRTGRFASGDEDKGYFNLQQIPKETIRLADGKEIAEYRACFKTDPGRKIATLDYTGCEIVCMISLSNDLELKKISELPDQHSYMGTKCWRAVYKHRYNVTKDPQWLALSETYVMTKGKARDKFKNSGVFPVIYGVRSGKVAAIQSINRTEAQIFIDTIEGEMPNVVAFVKEKAEFAKKHGYVIHNYRTNSRRWFYPVILANRAGEDLTSGEAITTETAARNSPIQGTNVDIICEAIVTIHRWARLYKVPIRLLGQVHDELIYDFPEEMDWIPAKLQKLMSMVAQRYLIPQISMQAGCDVGYYWIK
jgi:DNA polymerase I-like protein with 3'-5' exonuclease and polymerase domains